MQTRRSLLGTIGAAGIASIAGCSADSGGGTPETSDTDASDGGTSEPSNTDTAAANASNAANEAAAAAGVVEEYYTAAARGDVERAAELLSLRKSEEDRSIDEIVAHLKERGMSDDGYDGELGEFNALSVAEFTEFTFLTPEGDEHQMTEEQATDYMTMGEAYGAMEDEVAYVHYTGGITPEIWVPYQPERETLEREYPDGWGEVIVEVGQFEGAKLILGDFRSFKDFKVIDDR